MRATTSKTRRPCGSSIPTGSRRCSSPGRGGAVERLDFAAELEKTAYQRWFACLFETFVAALDAGDAGTRFLDDIGRVASVVEHAYAAARSGATVAIPDGV